MQARTPTDWLLESSEALQPACGVESLRSPTRAPRDRLEPCAEPGCEERAWPGSLFCAWHPKLRLVELDD